ncbi:hypothetical protein [Rheinheimera sp.]|uniref:hypothetical protein n=1 Tax=Rheinheimera sp. TaxID=1869214 RepID=UPI002737474E|nr:hypothetical protein [Rheinheimera sp.]MDP2715304.1 hypothetical protein [Rheinheimera sp.]
MRYLLIISVITAFIWPLTAQAHKFSTAYMDVTEQQGQPALLWKVALHDLAQAGLIQAKDSHQVRWQQVLDSEPQLQDYIRQRLSFSSAAGACDINTAAADWLVQRVQQDTFLLLPLQVRCDSIERWQLSYTALFDSQHSHKLLLSWQLPPDKANAVLSPTSPLYPALLTH